MRLDILAPGESDFVAVIEAYFDESGSHDGSPVLCVAGYVFDKDRCKQFDLEWKEVLDVYKLPYFHMVDCAHRNPPFDHLTREETIACEKALIAIIRDHMSFGVAIAVNEAQFDAWMPHSTINPIENAYSFCCWMCLIAIKKWAQDNDYRDDIAYFFEAGHKHQSTANRMMNRIFNNPRLKADYQYHSHAFVQKEKVRPVQASDLFAWLQATQFKRWMSNNKTLRKDLAALVENRDYRLLYGSHEMLSDLINYFQRVALERSRMKGPILPISGTVHGTLKRMWTFDVTYRFVKLDV